MGIEHGHKRLSLIALVNNVEHVAGIAAESIKARDDKFVLWSKELDYGRKFGSTLATAARRGVASVSIIARGAFSMPISR